MNSLQLNIKPSGEISLKADGTVALILGVAIGVGIIYYVSKRANAPQLPIVKPTQRFLDVLLRAA
ncbi:MAG TPA: hypothetical protein VF676_06455 [Flavobacterium sp.]|jgi:hypothetical protein